MESMRFHMLVICGELCLLWTGDMSHMLIILHIVVFSVFLTRDIVGRLLICDDGTFQFP